MISKSPGSRLVESSPIPTLHAQNARSDGRLLASLPFIGLQLSSESSEWVKLLRPIIDPELLHVILQSHA